MARTLKGLRLLAMDEKLESISPQEVIATFKLQFPFDASDEKALKAYLQRRNRYY